MRQMILSCCLALLFHTASGQDSDTWTAFWNEDTTLIGFKDQHGTVKIQPQFMGLTMAKRFDHIIAVMEEANGSYESYYLTKNGRIVGKDSLHIFDNGADCESEGFIRFKNNKTDKAGLLNSRGAVVIPAEYNDLTRVRNGMIVALKGAKKKFWENDKHSGCNHYTWTGGKEVLIDTNNKVLIDNFTYDDNLNFFSLQRTATPSKDLIRKSFLGKDGQYYSFIDFEKEFKSWLKASFLYNFSKETLVKATFDKVTYWKEPDGWTSAVKKEFIDRNFTLIQSKLLQLKSASCDYHISNEGLNPYLFEGGRYQMYFNNCGEAKAWLYPVKSIIIDYKNNKALSQDHFEFLRTTNGYQLISVSIKEGKEELK